MKSRTTIDYEDEECDVVLEYADDKYHFSPELPHRNTDRSVRHAGGYFGSGIQYNATDHLQTGRTVDT